VIDYQAVDNITNELRDQYAIQEESGYRYKNPKDLEDIFRVQAGKLAAQGVKTIYEIAPASWTVEKTGREVTNLINTRTGDVLLEARLQEGWEEDPTAFTFKQTRNADREVVNAPIELQKRGEGFDRWGFDTSVEGMAHYGVTFSSGVPVFTPYYKDTSSKIFGINLEDAVKTAIVIAAIYYGGQYLLGGETAAAAGAAEAGAATAGAGTGAGISGAGLTSGEMALLKGAETYGAGTAGLSAGAGATGFSLLEGAQFPVEGLQGVASTSPSAAAPFAGAAEAGLAVPTIPGLNAMGGAQGLTIPVAGGTISQLGLVPTGATPILGDPSSFINDPNLLGNAVFSTDTLMLPGETGLDLLDTARTIKSVTDLLGNEQTQPRQQQQQQPMSRPQSQFSLPAPRQTVVGLLPLAERYRRSLI
jgi:hypothetical protein